jgi:hypothetical protein
MVVPDTAAARASSMTPLLGIALPALCRQLYQTATSPKKAPGLVARRFAASVAIFSAQVYVRR